MRLKRLTLRIRKHAISSKKLKHKYFSLNKHIFTHQFLKTKIKKNITKKKITPSCLIAR